MAHLERLFPLDVSKGCTVTRERRTDVVQLASGREERNQRWKNSRRSISAGLAIRSADAMAAILDLYEEAAGSAHSFRFRDWTDWRSAAPSAPIRPTDQPLGTGDGSQTAFQIVKRYGTAQIYDRPVQLPHPASVRVAVNGTETSAWTLTAVGGLVVFDSAPVSGAVLTCGFTYDLPVRFDADTLAAAMEYFEPDGRGYASAPSVSLIEVRL